MMILSSVFDLIVLILEKKMCAICMKIHRQISDAKLGINQVICLCNVTFAKKTGSN